MSSYTEFLILTL